MDGVLRGTAEAACDRLTAVSYAGDITPQESWTLLNDHPDAVLVDVRTDAEWRWVGVPDLSGLGRDVVFIEWNRGTGQRNENFVGDLIAAGVLDQLALTVSPHIASGEGPRIAHGAAPRDGLAPARLTQLIGDDEGYLYFLWDLPSGPAGDSR